MERLWHDTLDAGRMVAAAFLGWTVTASDLELWLKLLIAATTLVYMVGKACLVWLHYCKERKDDKCEPQDD